MKRTTIVYALLGLTAAVFTSCGPPEQEQPEPVRPVVTIRTPAPEKGRRRTFSGTAQASLATPLSFRVSGEIIELPAKLGQKIATGDLIARLDATDYELEIKQMEAQLAQAEAQLEQARAEYERVRQLYEAENVSKSELDGQQAFFKSARAQRDAAAKALDLTRQQLAYCTLLAPISGSIAQVDVEQHQTVQAGQTVATLSSGQDVKLEIGIPEVLIAQVEVGAPVEVRFDSVPDTVFPAQVSAVGVELSTSSTYPVEVHLNENDPRVRPGMIGEAVFLFPGSGREVIYVPAVAVVGDPSGERYVWIADPKTGRVRKRIVTVGALTSDGLEILGGLVPGEHLVTRGVHRLSEDMRVRVLDN